MTIVKRRLEVGGKWMKGERDGILKKKGTKIGLQ